MDERHIERLLGLLDETVGSWHRYVDVMEKIADNLEELVEAEKNKISLDK